MKLKWKIILFIFLAVYLGLFFAHRIYFVTADLGRHIKNGEVFFRDGFPIATNYYSYTASEFPAINHHWASGVLFYVIWKYFSFPGLTIFNIVLNLGAFTFFLLAGLRKSNFAFVFLAAVLAVPLIASRTEIRPEVFSFLLLAIYYYLLSLFEEGRIVFPKLILILILLQISWCNLHIFFIMGYCLVAVYWLNSLITRNGRLKYYSLLLMATLGASLLNPYGLKGFIEPFMIFREYGYQIAENMNIIFMQRRFPKNFTYLHFELLFFLIWVSFFSVIRIKKISAVFPDLILAFTFSCLTWRTIRGIPIFSLLFIPIFAANISLFFRNKSVPLQRLFQKRAVIAALFLLILGLSSRRVYCSPFKGYTGLGLFRGVNRAADFFKHNEIKGPLFNNYDIGGYLIYHLFPQERVFVDNRPEAYPISFFKETYEPMQENAESWKRTDGIYNFNAIFFYRYDNTQHGQPFLIKRLSDPEWAPVFVDDYNIIFLKRNELNQEIIDEHELPRSIFKVESNE